MAIAPFLRGSMRPLAPPAVRNSLHQQTRRILAACIAALPERERIVLTLYYYEGLTLAEIGSVLSVTESRVSQIHTKAVIHLRARLAATDR